MSLTAGQLLGGAGIVSAAQTQAEDALMQSRKRELELQQLNRMDAANREIAAQFPGMIGQAPIQFAQTPGQQMGAGLMTMEAPETPATPRSYQVGAPGLTVPTLKAPEADTTAAGSQLARLQTLRQQQASLQQLAPTVPGGAADRPRTDQLAATVNEIKKIEAQMQGAAQARQRLDVLDKALATMPANNPLRQQYVDERNNLYKQYSPYWQAPTIAQMEATPTNNKQFFNALEAQYQLPAGLLNAVMMQESGGRPGQTSAAGAQGYFQFMPGTAQQYGVKVNDFRSESEGAAKMLSDLLKQYKGDVGMALAAYNWGSGNIAEKGIANMPAETRNYIPSVLKRMGVTVPEGTTDSGKLLATTINEGGTPTQVANTVANITKPAAKGGIMYGPNGQVSAQTPELQQVMNMRQALVGQVNVYAKYGMAQQAGEAFKNIQAVDLGLYKMQADAGIYEGATTGNFSRAMSVLSAFRGAPHQVLQRGDGKFDLYVNGNVTKTALDATQVEQLVRTGVDSEYRKQLAALQTERAGKAFESQLKIGEKASEITLTAAKDIQKAMVEGNFKLAEERLKQLGGKLTVDTATGIAYLQRGGDYMVIDPRGKTVEINGTKVETGPTASPIAGLNFGAVQVPPAR